MTALLIVGAPVALYIIWRLLRAADDEITGWDRVVSPAPFDWAAIEDLYLDLDLRASVFASTLRDVERLPELQP